MTPLQVFGGGGFDGSQGPQPPNTRQERGMDAAHRLWSDVTQRGTSDGHDARRGSLSLRADHGGNPWRFR
jgi:hypothetical protein